MLNHATFKASLFMAAGIIDHEAGTRDLRRLSGLFRYMPITGTLVMVASAAMAGVPLLNGFLSKEMFFAEAVETHADSWVDTIAPYAAVVGSALAVTYSIRLIHSIFLGAPPESFPREPHEPPFWMRFPGHVPGNRVSRRRHFPRPDRRALPACRRVVGARRCNARIQPGNLARLQPFRWQ